MKKKIVLAMVVVMGIFAISPLSDAVNKNQEDIMYAKTSDKSVLADRDDETIIDNEAVVSDSQKEDIVENDTNILPSQDENINEVRDKDIIVNHVNVSKAKNIESSKLTDKDLNPKNTTIDEEQVSNNESLNKDEALNILKNKGLNVDYSYMGDEKYYSVLKEKGHEGYVFLPNVNTDMGLFVDKNTKEVYYFNPSGYIDQY